MPSIDANINSWDKDWGHDGDHWSQAWGSSAAMWRGSVLARIGHYLPTGNVLEIAPGRGRLTEFLLPQCRDYIGIDLAPTCIEACRTRFQNVAHAKFATGDGRSLAAVADDSIDFGFSWDSLVHADAEVLQSYIAELARVLRPGGTAFLHHSNLAAFAEQLNDGRVENPHWRDPTVTAEIVRAACAQNGLSCLAQEFVQWGVSYYNDCFTLLQRPTTDQAAISEPVIMEHPDLNSEMALFRSIDQGYWRT